MNQIDNDLECPVPTDIDEQQKLPDDVLEALGAGRLTDIKYLGSGATSSVFSAHDNRLDKRVAIKFLKHANQGRLINFQKEAKLASQLRHDNLVRILNFGVTKKNHAFLIMEFVDGKSLETILEEKHRIPLSTSIRLLMQICDGLAHSHAKRIAHRDLKTANVLVQGYGTDAMRAIIVDFGLAQQRQSQEETTPGSNSGKIKGSPLFISPEQAQGKPGGESSDIYSLGCIAFNMLTGTLPFESDDTFDLLKMHIEQPAPAMADRAPALDFPPALEKCVQRMLEKNPENRFHSILEVKENLSPSRKILSQIANPASSIVPKRIRRSFVYACIIALVTGFGAFILGTPAPVPSVEKKAESSQEKFDRLFKYDIGSFLSHFGRKYICPKHAGGITDEDLECLAEVNLLTPNINLAFTNINGTGLAKLRSIHELKLDLSKTEMSEEGFKTIGTLQNLQGLCLFQAKVSLPLSETKADSAVVEQLMDSAKKTIGDTINAVAAPKGDITKAESTEVTNAVAKPKRQLVDITIKEITEVAKAGNLLELNLDMCHGVDDQCLELLTNLPLIVFTARDARKITDKGVMALARCKDVNIVHLDGTAVTDKAAEMLSQQGKLVDFRVNRCPMITGTTLKTLCDKNPKLQYVGLSFTKTTTKDLHILDGRDLKFLEILGIPIGPDEMRMIGQMRNMEIMYLSNVEDRDSLQYLYSLKNAQRIMIMDSKNLDVRSVSKLQTQLPNATVLDGMNRAVRPDVEDFKRMFMEGSNGENPFDLDLSTDQAR